MQVKGAFAFKIEEKDNLVRFFLLIYEDYCIKKIIFESYSIFIEKYKLLVFLYYYF